MEAGFAFQKPADPRRSAIDPHNMAPGVEHGAAAERGLVMNDRPAAGAGAPPFQRCRAVQTVYWAILLPPVGCVSSATHAGVCHTVGAMAASRVRTASLMRSERRSPEISVQTSGLLHCSASLQRWRASGSVAAVMFCALPLPSSLPPVSLPQLSAHHPTGNFLY